MLKLCNYERQSQSAKSRAMCSVDKIVGENHLRAFRGLRLMLFRSANNRRQFESREERIQFI